MSDPHRLDKRFIRRSFDRAAAGYDRAAVLQREVCDRMFSRLDYIKQMPRAILDAGCGTGYGTRKLAERYRGVPLVALDLASGMLRQARGPVPWWKRFTGGDPVRHVCGDVEALPLRSGSMGLAWSNLTLQWVDDPRHAFAEMHRVLEVEGLFMFSTFGPDTLKELREAFAGVDGHTHVSRFVDMHDLGDALVAAGFANPVMDMEYFTVTYQDMRDVMRDLKAIGAHNATEGRRRGLSGRRAWAEAAARYERLRRGGKLPATFEVVYGHAWKPEPRKTADGRAIVKMDMRRRREA